MLELPEVLVLSAQLREAVCGKQVLRVLPPTKAHKFCWYTGDPADYNAALQNTHITDVEGFGLYVEMVFSNGLRLCVNDGVNLRLMPITQVPKAYQLLMELSDGMALVFTVAMYGGIELHDAAFDNMYYQKSRAFVSPFSEAFPAHFRALLAESKPNLSMKALIATEQRFPGIGNGTAQDILFSAGLHPKRKLATLTPADAERLLTCIPAVLQNMLDHGGRDTEKDLYGNPGAYRTRMSKNTYPVGCPSCGGPITKEAYLGGSVYYCAHCQPLS